MADFQRVKGKKIYEIVISQLKEKITSGEIGPGDMLPPEKSLAEKMGVSRASVREALKVLEFMGLLESKPGGGTTVAHVHPDLLVDKLNTVSLSVSDSLLLDLIELRETLEPKIVELAIMKASDAELAEIEKIVESVSLSSDPAFIIKGDSMLHLAIARASHNIFYIRLIEASLSMLEEIRTRTVALVHLREEVQREHEDIVESLRNRDKRNAVKAIKRHLSAMRVTLDVSSADNSNGNNA